MKNRFRIECTKTRPHASTFSDVFRICFHLISNTLSKADLSSIKQLFSDEETGKSCGFSCWDGSY
jgi:hypothetical protein